MAKKKKKITKPTYVPIDQRPKEPMSKKLKYGLIIGACVLVLAVVLFLIFYDDGSLPVGDDGIAVTGGDNWIVANLGTSDKPKYYKTGEIDPLEGYTLEAEGVDQMGMKIYSYLPEDEGADVANYYVTGMKGEALTNAQSANSSYMMYYGDTDISPVQSTVIGGQDVYYFTTISPEDTSTTEAIMTEAEGEVAEEPVEELVAEEETQAEAEPTKEAVRPGRNVAMAEDVEPEAEVTPETKATPEADTAVEPEPIVTDDASDAPAEEALPEEGDSVVVPVLSQRDKQMVCYVPAIRNSTILINVSTYFTDEAEIMDDQQMMAFLEKVLTTITFEEK